MLCENCKSWELTDSSEPDRYCGWCGVTLYQIECTASPETVYVHMNKSSLPSFSLLIKNNGVAPVAVNDVIAQPQGYISFPYLDHSSQEDKHPSDNSERNGRLILQPGEIKELQGKFYPDIVQQLANGYAETKILDRGDRSEISEGVPSHEVDWEQQQAEQSQRVEMSSKQDQDLVDTEGSSGIKFGFQLDLSPELEKPRCSVRVLPLEVRKPLVPRLAFLDIDTGADTPAKLSTWALAGRVRSFPFRIKNSGEQKIEILAIETTFSLECLVLKKTVLPIELEPGATKTISFFLDTQSVEKADVLSGDVAFRFRGDSKSVYSSYFTLVIDVTKPRLFRGITAIDIGTTYTCVAVSESHKNEYGNSYLIPVHGDTHIPTAIRYKDISEDGHHEIEIGKAAFAQDGKPEQDVCVIKNFIRNIGKDLTQEIKTDETGEKHSIKTETIIADYLKKILAEAENQIAARLFLLKQNNNSDIDFGACLLKQALITYSATYTYRQKSTMKEIAEEVGIKVGEDILFQPAPTAASFQGISKFIGQWTNDVLSGGLTNQCHFLIYDLGGNSTQMALLQMDITPKVTGSSSESTLAKVNTKLLGLDGDDQFGGDDITAVLIESLMIQAKDLLQQELQQDVTIPLWEHPHELPDSETDLISYHNLQRLTTDAENLKCHLTEIHPDSDCVLAQTNLYVMIGGDVKMFEFQDLAVNGRLLEKRVGPRLDLHLRKIQNLVNNVGLEAPHFIRLAGMSTLLPIVRTRLNKLSAIYGCKVGYFRQEQTIEPHSKALNLLPIEDLKSCTALGGIELLRQAHLNGVVFMDHLNSAQKINEQIGIVLKKRDGLKFWKIVKKGAAVPVEFIVPAFKMSCRSRLHLYKAKMDGQVDDPANATSLGSYSLSDFQPAIPKDFSDEEFQKILRAGKLRFRLTSHKELYILLQLRGKEHKLYIALFVDSVSKENHLKKA